VNDIALPCAGSELIDCYEVCLFVELLLFLQISSRKIKLPTGKARRRNDENESRAFGANYGLD